MATETDSLLDRGGPRKKEVMALEVLSYSLKFASSSRLRLTADDCDICLPLLFAGATSLRLVKEPSAFGISMSISTSLLRSTIISPPIAHPAVPYPPALMDGDSECLTQKHNPDVRD